MALRLFVIIFILLISNAVRVNAAGIAELQEQKSSLEMSLKSYRAQMLAVNQQWHAVFLQRNANLNTLWNNYLETINKNKPPHQEAMNLYMQTKAQAAQIKASAAQLISSFRSQDKQIMSELNVTYMQISQIEAQISQLKREHYQMLHNHPMHIYSHTPVYRSPSVNHRTIYHHRINLHPKIYRVKTQEVVRTTLPLENM